MTEEKYYKYSTSTALSTYISLQQYFDTFALRNGDLFRPPGCIRHSFRVGRILAVHSKIISFFSKQRQDHYMLPL